MSGTAEVPTFRPGMSNVSDGLGYRGGYGDSPYLQ